jgi:hypothetical protein
VKKLRIVRIHNKGLPQKKHKDKKAKRKKPKDKKAKR